jgi:hypothetical protein
MPELPPGEYVIVGGDVDGISASLRVMGDDLDPDEVTRLLGVKPRRGGKQLRSWTPAGVGRMHSGD